MIPTAVKRNSSDSMLSQNQWAQPQSVAWRAPMQRKTELIAWHTAAKRLVIRGWSDDHNAQPGGIMTRGHVSTSVQRYEQCGAHMHPGVIPVE